MFSVKDTKIGRMLKELFDSDRIPNEFFTSTIGLLRSFEGMNPQECVVELLDIYKGVCKNCSNGINSDDSEIRGYLSGIFRTLFDKLPSKAIAKINALSVCYKFNIDDMERMDPNSYTHYDRFYVFGCPDSTDIDVAVICPSSANRCGGVKDLYSSEVVRLRSDLMAIGYDVESREIDYNPIIIEGRKIIASEKGGVETANIILATYAYHAQAYPPDSLELDTIELDSEMFDTKIRSLAKYIWDYLKYITRKEDYKRIHDFRSEIYSCTKPIDAVNGLKTILDDIIEDPNVAELYGFDMQHWRTVFKTITMKLVQIIVFDIDSTMSYTKREIATDSRKICVTYPLDSYGMSGDDLYNGCAYNLTRGRTGQYHRSVFSYLLNGYFKIANRLLARKKKVYTVNSATILASTKRPGDVSVYIIDRFLESPKIATPEFETAWNNFVDPPDRHDVMPVDRMPVDRMSVNQVFAQNLTLSTVILERLVTTAIPKETIHSIEKHFVMVDQKSKAWLDLQSFYVCGKNGAEIGSDFQAIYNLIRGSILECLCVSVCPIFNCRPSYLKSLIDEVAPEFSNLLEDVVHIIVLEVGMVVEEVGLKGCRGASPDLILIGLRIDKEPVMIPVEIKGLKSSVDLTTANENADYRRGVSLASRQLSSIKQIISDGFVIEFGIIVLSWIFDRDMGMEAHVVPL